MRSGADLLEDAIMFLGMMGLLGVGFGIGFCCGLSCGLGWNLMVDVGVVVDGGCGQEFRIWECLTMVEAGSVLIVFLGFSWYCWR